MCVFAHGRVIDRSNMASSGRRTLWDRAVPKAPSARALQEQEDARHRDVALALGLAWPEQRAKRQVGKPPNDILYQETLHREIRADSVPDGVTAKHVETGHGTRPKCGCSDR